MNSILHVALGSDASLASSLEALPLPVTRLDVARADVLALRGLAEAAAGSASAFILTIGPERLDQAVTDVDWERQVRIPLGQAFGLLTGAGRRFRQDGRGVIVVMAPSAAVGAADISTPQLVLLRSIVGLTEALRAELQATPVRVSLVFHDGSDQNNTGLAARLAAVLAAAPLYSLSQDITAERIETYFTPLLDAVDQTEAGSPLPDIGPMAAVYDLIAAGAPSSTA